MKSYLLTFFTTFLGVIVEAYSQLSLGGYYHAKISNGVNYIGENTLNRPYQAQILPLGAAGLTAEYFFTNTSLGKIGVKADIGYNSTALRNDERIIE
jgi:hypothetical protein